MVVVAVAGPHTREIWSRLPLEIAVAIEDRCRGWGPLYINVILLGVCTTTMLSRGSLIRVSSLAAALMARQ